ncbi:AAA family ATPase [Neiella sp. HB171785]|uniref:AAA family ATPase n=1 Tax=Neiella litorisoli TaxID=2771431 RepID=A0A8J6UE87_9GAMM|nr:MoxR family ATPase [Neiella litorisoli]MBD1389369.1 AAA family ATPase [Neiella litorisoli]
MTTQPAAQLQQVQPVDYTQMGIVKGEHIFPEKAEWKEADFKMRKHRHADCISPNPNYLPQDDILRFAVMWLQAPAQLKVFGLWGETGTGKTEFAMWLASRFNLPFYKVSITPEKRGHHLETEQELVAENGQVVTQRILLPAAQAYRDGGLLLLDEVDKATDDMTTSLHNILEGKPWHVPGLGTLKKHPQCYIMTTSNTKGEGGHDRYITSQALDAALRRRIGWFETKYPDAIHETKILSNQFTQLPTVIITRMVETANAFRDALLGEDRSGKIEGSIRCTFSTADLVAWAYYMLRFGMNCTPRDSLSFAFWGNVDAEDEDAAQAIVTAIWSESIDEPVKELISNAAKK